MVGMIIGVTYSVILEAAVSYKVMAQFEDMLEFMSVTYARYHGSKE